MTCRGSDSHVKGWSRVPVEQYLDTLKLQALSKRVGDQPGPVVCHTQHALRSPCAAFVKRAWLHFDPCMARFEEVFQKAWINAVLLLLLLLLISVQMS